MFSWSGQKKCVGSMFLGTSPELDLAAYTVCFLTREKRSCHLEYNGKPVRIVTHGHTVKGKTYIATAYPDFG